MQARSAVTRPRPVFSRASNVTLKPFSRLLSMKGASFFSASITCWTWVRASEPPEVRQKLKIGRPRPPVIPSVAKV